MVTAPPAGPTIQDRPPAPGVVQERAQLTRGSGVRRGFGTAGGVLGWILLAGIPLAMFVLFFCYPVGSLIGRGLAPAGTVDVQGVIDVLGKPRVQRIALFTGWQA